MQRGNCKELVTEIHFHVASQMNLFILFIVIRLGGRGAGVIPRGKKKKKNANANATANAATGTVAAATAAFAASGAATATAPVRNTQ